MKADRLVRVGGRLASLYSQRRRTASAVGVDIGSHSIKIVGLKKNSGAGSCFSASAGEVFLRSDCLRDKETGDFNSVISNLSFLCGDLGLKGRRAAVSLSGGAVFTGRVKVAPRPASSQKQIEDAVRSRVERFFPEGADDYYCDFHPVAPDLNEVFFAVAKRDAVDNYVSALSASGLLPEVVDYDGFALVNSYKRACNSIPSFGRNMEGVAVLLNVGRTVTNLAVLEGSTPVFTRDLSCGSEELTLAIARAGDLTPDEAELAKTSLSGDSNTEFLRLAADFSLGVAREVKSNLEIFLDCADKRAEKIVLSGGGSLLYGFREVFAETMRADVEYADPIGGLDGISSGFDAEHLGRLSPKSAVAFGLALRVAE